MDYVILANSWDAAGDNPTSKHQIALELARKGNRVLWVEGAGMRRPSVGSGADRSRMAGKLRKAFAGAAPAPGVAGIHVLTPLILPVPSLGLVRALNSRLILRLAGKWARRLGFREPALINYVPVHSGVLKGWKWKRVYHCVDRWDRFDMYDAELMKKVDEECCRHAELVIASSLELYERCRKVNANTHMVSHGVDHGHFAAALEMGRERRPEDLPAGRIVGFFGLLSEWVDRDLLAELARAVPDAHVVLIGKADISGFAGLAAERNVVMIGPKPFAELPRYVAFFDAGIIPFKVNELTDAVNPIKLREMLAAGCPVVSTATREVRHYAQQSGVPGLHVAASSAEFVAEVKALLARPAPADERRRISAAVRGETWAAKVDEIVRLMRKVN